MPLSCSLIMLNVFAWHLFLTLFSRINAHNVWEPSESVIMLLSNVPLNSLCHLKKVEFVYRGRGDTRVSLVFSISMGVFDLLHELD